MTPGVSPTSPRPAWVREECPFCHQVERVRADGTFAYHQQRVSPWHMCAGSRKPPSSHVHRCDCGARWDEDA